MKNIYILIITTLLLTSCGGDKKSVESIIEKENLVDIRTKKNEISNQIQAFSDQLKQLDVAIAKLDTTKKVPLITTFTAKQGVFNHYLELQGNVQTKKNIIIYGRRK